LVCWLDIEGFPLLYLFSVINSLGTKANIEVYYKG